MKECTVCCLLSTVYVYLVGDEIWGRTEQPIVMGSLRLRKQ